MVGGRTGAGKTRLLAQCAAKIDLEALAHHRGSAFGHHPQPQPTQIAFENALSIALLKQVDADNRPFAVEDESRNIGGRHIPDVFFRRMETAPVVIIEASDEERVEITLQEYVHDALAEFREVNGPEAGFTAWADYLLASLDRIRRRLGGDRHQKVRARMQAAIERHAGHGDDALHRVWIADLLHDYYDGMYEYQLAANAERVVFSGPADAVLEFLDERYGIVAADRPQPQAAAAPRTRAVGAALATRPKAD